MAGVNISGVGPDTPIETNANGGKQSTTPYRFDLLDAPAMFQLAAIAGKGAAKYGVSNWRKIDTRSHLNHALIHVFAYLAGDKSEDHLEHAFCRMMFAVAMKGG